MRFPRFLLMFSVASLFVVSSPAQTVSAVADFSSSVGCDPWYTIVAQGRDGNLYTTLQQCDTNNNGSVVKITPQGALTVIYSFDGVHGSLPQSGLTLGTDGNFYGTTAEGGSTGGGTIFRITPTGTLTVMYNFPGGVDGSMPTAAPVQASDGNFYGTARYGGPDYICGIIYRMTLSGTVTILHQFVWAQGCQPSAPLTQGSDGWLYGTTAGDEYPEPYELGNIFKVNPQTSQFIILHSFNGTDGTRPTASVIEGSDGNWYGTASGGGTALGRAFNHGGTLFSLTPSGTLTVLHNFNPDLSSGDACTPYAGLIQATNRIFYGDSFSGGGTAGPGALYSMDLSDDYSVFYNFAYPNGNLPASTMMQHTNGNLYGVTTAGGELGGGVLYSLNEGLAPFVAFVLPAGEVGKTAQILGQGLTGTTSVTFNGVAATTFGVVSDTYMTAVVPNGASTGPVVVATPGGTLTSNVSFKIIN